MSNYRRARIRRASYFFTVALYDRRSDPLVREIDALRAAYCSVQRHRPFTCDAFIVLPDHLHSVWTLPPDDNDFSTRWAQFKGLFTKRIRQRGAVSHSKTRKREAGIWQRRFWEHCIRDEAEHAAYVQYCWSNPVKHGYVADPRARPHSSINRDMRRGIVPAEWSGGAITQTGPEVLDPYDRFDAPAYVGRALVER